ncbi:hypothetical protein BS627_01170 [Agrobacterium salinitolerans]|uniref:AAA family ATPase n=1 Tax=Agrobacterium salinitolerans TaxID=1183413 RepID=UPI000990291E|nr:AAA family ATPase [Agrobacterium salinitolerans]OOO28799.1 hypothetical protein BS627_01170 [Agrobacterium salinitolerans]PNQ26354.1 hypothetical protein C2E26_01190 [Rhizobium sp. YIC5082]
MNETTEVLMQIKRMQVDAGFLAGFDVSFSPGLNVIIGARGTGKTSILELMRFAFASPNHSTEASKRSYNHAINVLQDGEVHLTVDFDILGETELARTATEDEPRGGPIFQSPLMFSQTEIESIALSSRGRLQLLDRFVAEKFRFDQDEAAVANSVKSIFKSIENLQKETESLTSSVSSLPTLRKELALLEQDEKKYSEQSSMTPELRARLSSLMEYSASLTVTDTIIERFEEKSRKWADALSALLKQDYGLEDIQLAEDKDPLSLFRAPYRDAIEGLKEIAGTFVEMQSAAAQLRPSYQRRRIDVDNEARKLRTELENTSEGAGNALRKLHAAQTQLAKIVAAESALKERNQRLEELRIKRDQLLDRLDYLRKVRHELRTDAADALNAGLSPQIKIDVERLGDYSEYSQALVESLRGSGLRYGEIISSITEQITPRELVKFIETGDYEAFAQAADIAPERAFRLASYLADKNLSEIATANIDDEVNFLLLDGIQYKPVESLSAGQRCTVVLSIVLQLSDNSLVLDQPEDHLDNAFVASTIIKALNLRKSDTQIILTTHNANIPVLGGADLVIEMSSDGRNGFVQVCQPLENAEAVASITKVMEGGREAFARRARFYTENS